MHSVTNPSLPDAMLDASAMQPRVRTRLLIRETIWGGVPLVL